LGVKESDHKYLQLFKAVEQRVDARLFLETVAMLNPEQAALVKQDMEKNNPNPQELLTQVIHEIPNFQLRVVQVLANLRSELLQDLSKKEGS